MLPIPPRKLLKAPRDLRGKAGLDEPGWHACNDAVGLTIEYYMRFKDQMGIAAEGRSRLKLVIKRG